MGRGTIYRWMDVFRCGFPDRLLRFLPKASLSMLSLSVFAPPKVERKGTARPGTLCP